MPVERDAGLLVAHRGPAIGMAGGLLDVAKRHARIERGGDERVTQGMGSHPLREHSAASDTPHDSAGRVTVDPFPIGLR